MAISVRATTTGPNPLATSTTINLPAGTTTGDLTIIVGAYNVTANDVTMPSGWTVIGNAAGMFACYRLYQGGDPSSVTFTGSGGNSWWQTVAASFIGCDATTPVDTFNSYYLVLTNGASATYRAPSVAPNYNNDLLLACFISGDSLGDSQSVPAGFSTVIATANGPSVLIASQQLSSAAQTGDQTTTASHSNQPKSGFQIALHASGDTAATLAAPVITWGGLYDVVGVSSPYTPAISLLNPQVNDLVCICAVAGGETTATPTGFTQQGGGQDVYMFTRFFQMGDTDPSISQSASNYYTTVCFLLRSTNGQLATIDQTNTQVGSGTPSSATLSTLTPAHANEYLVAYWGQSATAGNTWTPSGSLTTQISNSNGPDVLIQDTQPASSPTGTFTATSGSNNTIFAIEMLVIPPSNAPTSAGGVFFGSTIS